MSKPFKTLRQQIRILRDRNLKIKHGGFTQNILSKENYYCIINGYKEIYLDKSQSIEKYENNVTFEHVYSLYNFDRELRNLFLRKLLKLENYTNQPSWKRSIYSESASKRPKTLYRKIS